MSALALLAGAGVFGSRFPDELLFDNAVGEFFTDNGSWLWPAVAVAALVLAGLAVGWLRPSCARPGSARWSWNPPLRRAAPTSPAGPCSTR